MNSQILHILDGLINFLLIVIRPTWHGMFRWSMTQIFQLDGKQLLRVSARVFASHSHLRGRDNFCLSCSYPHQ